MNLASEASAIERFPHVIERICALWGTHDLDQYITHLMTDTRDGQRRGFPAEVTAELLFLAEINKLVRAIDLARRLQIPLREAYQKIDKQDRGRDLGDPLDPLFSRDIYAREAGEITLPPLPTAGRTPQQSEGGGFFALVGKLAIALLVLYLIGRFLLHFFNN
jgi:hypothetical protein